MSVHNYTRATKPGGWDIDNVDHIDSEGKQIKLATEIVTALPGKNFRVRMAGTSVDVDFYEDTLTGPETTTLNTAVTDHQAISSLNRNKRKRIKEIDDKDDDLIRKATFTYDSKTFSLRRRARERLVALYTTRSDITYPIDYTDKSGLNITSLADAPEVKTFYEAAFAVARGHIDDGNVYRASIRAASTQAAIDAVVDTR